MGGDVVMFHLEKVGVPENQGFELLHRFAIFVSLNQQENRLSQCQSLEKSAGTNSK